jgi:hypothetical protein
MGRVLQSEGWKWGEGNNHIIDYYGSVCLAEATLALPFEQVISRIAPSALFRAVRVRGGQPEEALLAAEVVGRVLEAPAISAPDLGSDVSVNADKGWPFTYSVSVRKTPIDELDAVAMQQVFDSDLRTKALREAASTAFERIKAVRESGGSLYLAPLDVEDMSPIIDHAWPTMIKWFEGMTERTADFQRRVRLAESTYIAACEALLTKKPDFGVQLWRVLREVVSIRYVGLGGVDVLVHAAFRAPDSPPIDELRHELVKPPLCTCDRDLFDVVIAAHAAERIDVIDKIVNLDRASSLPWRRRRGEVLSGFATRAHLPVSGAWPDGPLTTSHADLYRCASLSAWSDACARHWWSEYLSAPGPIRAYAAWLLFLQVADRRAWVWMSPRDQTPASAWVSDRLDHAMLNLSEMDRAMDTRADKSEKRFLFRKVCEHISPWATE